MKAIIAIILASALLASSSLSAAVDYEIKYIEPIFDKTTSMFGDFKIKVKIKSHKNIKETVSVACLYIGLTHPGVYYKNEPQVTKEYKQITLEPLVETELTFGKNFRSYHPETKGELIITIVGTGVSRSYPLQTRFHPESND